MKSEITLTDGHSLHSGSTPVNSTGTRHDKLVLIAAVAAAAVVMLLAGAFSVGLFQFPVHLAVSSERVATREPLPFGPNWAADYYTDMPRPIPFGPEIAATYGKPKDPLAGIYRLPFGPQIAADYGRPNDPLANIKRLPSGPGWAATYGCPPAQTARQMCAVTDIRR